VLLRRFMPSGVYLTGRTTDSFYGGRTWGVARICFLVNFEVPNGAPEVPAAVSAMPRPNDASGRDIQRGKRRRAVPHIIMDAALRLSRTHGSNGAVRRSRTPRPAFERVSFVSRQDNRWYRSAKSHRPYPPCSRVRRSINTCFTNL
jgi:hypothetical protein